MTAEGKPKEEESIKEENVPEIIGPENLKILMEDLLVINDPEIDIVAYSQKPLEQVKKTGSGEYATWLLHLASKEVFKEQMDIIIEHLIEKYGIDLKGYNPENKYTILSYISNQLRQKTRTKLWGLGKTELILKYSSIV